MTKPSTRRSGCAIRKNLISKTRHLNPVESLLFDRQIIDEIQYHTTYTPSRNPLRTAWNEEIHKVVEVIDQVVHTQRYKAGGTKDQSTVKQIGTKPKRLQKSQYKTKYRHRAKNNWSFSYNSSKNYDAIKRNRAKNNHYKTDNEMKEKKKDDDAISRPSSVTTLYTAFSNDLSEPRACDLTNKETQDHCQHYRINAADSILNRHVIEEINDSSETDSSYSVQEQDSCNHTKSSQDH